MASFFSPCRPGFSLLQVSGSVRLKSMPKGLAAHATSHEWFSGFTVKLRSNEQKSENSGSGDGFHYFHQSKMQNLVLISADQCWSEVTISGPAECFGKLWVLGVFNLETEWIGKRELVWAAKNRRIVWLVEPGWPIVHSHQLHKCISIPMNTRHSS